MENFIVVTNDGAYKCNPTLIKEITASDTKRILNNSSLARRISKTQFLIDSTRFEQYPNLIHGTGYINNSMTINCIEDNGKKIFFSLVKQLPLFSKYCLYNEEGSHVYPYIYRERGNEEVVYETSLMWASKPFVEAGIETFFVFYSTVDLENDIINDLEPNYSPHKIRSEGDKTDSQVNVEDAFASRPNANQFIDPHCFMVVKTKEGFTPCFPLMSNVYEDLRVCLGRSDIHSSETCTDLKKLFALSLLSFVFAVPNSDLLTVEANSARGNKVEMMRKFYTWDAASLAYSPQITMDEICAYAQRSTVRKHQTDLIINCIPHLT